MESQTKLWIGADEWPKKHLVSGTRVMTGLKKRHSPDGFTQIKMKVAYHLGCGEPYGILCRRFEGWYIKSIMAYLKQSGINAVYEKMHEKGLGFQGYLIKLKS